MLTVGSTGAGTIRFNFFPQIASDRITITLKMPQGTNEKITSSIITEIEKTIDTSYNSENSYVIATHSPQLLSNAQSELNFVKIIEDGALIENTPNHYGREINTILYELMGVEERNKLVRTKISDLYTLIDEEEIKDAESSLKELQDLIGGDDPELKRAEIQINYLKEDE